MTQKNIQELQALATAERAKKRLWPDIAETLLDQAVSPADMARAMLPLISEHGSVLAVLRAAVLLPPHDADFCAVRQVFEEHGIDLSESIKHLMSHSANKAANTAEAARRLGIQSA